MEKLISFIVPCYKVERYLPRCIDSLLAQTLDDIEIICINDGSPDNCLQILNDYHAQHPDKVIVIDKPNEGVWKGRRDGIALARGKYIGFVDSDDYVLPDFAESLYRAAVANDADIAVCGFNRVDLETEKILTTELSVNRPPFSIKGDAGRLIELNGAPWNKIFKLELLKNLDNLSEPPAILDDLIFHLLVYIKAQGTVAFVPKPLVRYMIRQDSIIHTIRADQVDGVLNSFAEVRKLYDSNKCTPQKQDMVATAAFLHLGISLLFRLSYDKQSNLPSYISKCTVFLDETFPRWRTAPYLKLSYAISRKGAFIKLWIVRNFYRIHAMPQFMALYRFAIDRLHIDIKW